MRVVQATESMVLDMWAGIEPRVQGSKHLEVAAQELAVALYDTFSDSVVLSRVYTTLPFEQLPAKNQTFVRNLVTSAKASGIQSQGPIRVTFPAIPSSNTQLVDGILS